MARRLLAWIFLTICIAPNIYGRNLFQSKPPETNDAFDKGCPKPEGLFNDTGYLCGWPWPVKKADTLRFVAVLSNWTEQTTANETYYGYKFWEKTVNEQGGINIAPDRNLTVEVRFGVNLRPSNATDYSDVHKSLLSQAVSETEGAADFILGGATGLAFEDNDVGQKNKRITMLCCHGPPTLYQRAAKTASDNATPNWLFGIHVSSELYTRRLIRDIVVNQKAEHIAVVVTLDEQNPEKTLFTNSTCQSAIEDIEELRNFGRYENPPQYTKYTISMANASNIEYFKALATNIADTAGIGPIVVACTLNEGKFLIEALKGITLRGLFVTVAPTNREIVGELENKNISSEYVLSAGQWHPELNFEADAGPQSRYLWANATSFANEFKKTYGSSASYTHASASAAAHALQLAIGSAFAGCEIQSQGIESSADIMKSQWKCKSTDNVETERTAYELVHSALKLLNENSFFGKIFFDSTQRNTGRDAVTFQLLRGEGRTAKIDDSIDFGPVDSTAAAAQNSTLKDANNTLVQEVVLPSEYETRAIVLPRPPELGFIDLCKDGEGLDLESNKCQDCRPGSARAAFLGNNSKAFYCDSCNLTSYQPNSRQFECLLCPENTQTRERGATEIEDCECKAGYYNLNQRNGYDCKQCPEGAICPGGSNAYILKPGYWSVLVSDSENATSNVELNLTSTYEIFACNPPKACIHSDNNVCSEGWGDVICSQCGYANSEEGGKDYFLLFGYCVECVSAVMNVAIFGAVMAVWLIINVCMAEAIQSFALFIDWMQLMSLVGNINVGWPDSLNAFYNLAAFFSFEVDVVSLRCAFPEWNFTSNMILQFVFPLVVVLALLLWASADYRNRGTNNNQLDTPSHEGCQTPKLQTEHVPPVHRSTPSKHVYRLTIWGIAKAKHYGTELAHRGRALNLTWTKFWMRVLNMLEITYLANTLYAFSALRYIIIQGQKRVASAPYTLWTPTILAIGIVGLVIYSILFPLAIILIMWSWSPECRFRRKKMRESGVKREDDEGGFKKKTSQTLLGWLYNEFRIEIYWMSWMHLVHRFFLVAAIALGLRPAVQLIIAVNITAASALLFILTKPYYNTRLNVLQITIYASILLQLCLGICYMGMSWGQFSATWRTAFTYCSFFFIAIVGAVLLWIVIIDFLEWNTRRLTRNNLREFYNRVIAEIKKGKRSESDINEDANFADYIEEVINLLNAPRLRSFVKPNYKVWKQAQSGATSTTDTVESGRNGESALLLVLKVAETLGKYLKNNSFSYLSLRDEAELWRELVLAQPEIIAYLFYETATNEEGTPLRQFFITFYKKYWNTKDTRISKFWKRVMYADDNSPDSSGDTKESDPLMKKKDSDDAAAAAKELKKQAAKDFKKFRSKLFEERVQLPLGKALNITWLVEPRQRAALARCLATNWNFSTNSIDLTYFTTLMVEISSISSSKKWCLEEKLMWALSCGSLAMFLEVRKTDRQMMFDNGEGPAAETSKASGGDLDNNGKLLETGVVE